MRSTRPLPLVSALLVAALGASGPALPQEQEDHPPGFLGISLEQVTDAVRAALALEEGAGVMVGKIVEGAAAEEAGMVEGDVIVAIDGRPIRGPRELMRAVAERSPGDALHLEVWRQGRVLLVEAFLGERPEGRAQPAARGGNRTLAGNPLGLMPLPLTDQLADYFIAPGGVLVARVAEGSPAEVAGVLAGDVVVSVDDQEVRSPGELASIVANREGPTVLLAVVRNGADIYLEVALP